MTVDTQTDFDDFPRRLVDRCQPAGCLHDDRTRWRMGSRPTRKTHDAIQRALAGQPERMVLDLSRLTFMDSTGIHGILELANLAARLKIDLMVIRGPQAVHRVFELCQLSERLTFIDAP